jgi:integrase
MKRKNNKKLFPNITVSESTGKAGSTFSKRFATFRKKLGLVGKGTDFHSFRHTLIGALRHAGVSESIGEDITGHAPTTIHGNYGDRHRLQVQRESLEKINYPIRIVPKP